MPDENRGTGDVEYRVVADTEAAVAEVALFLIDEAQASVAARGRFAVALTGGGVAEVLYRYMAAEYATRFPWERTVAGFGDDRCVPPTHEHSNYRMAAESLLDHVPIPRDAVHRIRGELAPEEAARDYEATLRRVFPGAAGPAFDVVLLGMGPDGHTASLFPGAPQLEERARWVVASEAPPAMVVRDRVTMTFPAIAAGRLVLMLVTGAEKAEAVRAVRGGATPRPPAARAHGAERTVWVLDRAAAGGG